MVSPTSPPRLLHSQAWPSRWRTGRDPREEFRDGNVREMEGGNTCQQCFFGVCLSQSGQERRPRRAQRFSTRVIGCWRGKRRENFDCQRANWPKIVLGHFSWGWLAAKGKDSPVSQSTVHGPLIRQHTQLKSNHRSWGTLLVRRRARGVHSSNVCPHRMSHCGPDTAHTHHTPLAGLTGPNSR